MLAAGIGILALRPSSFLLTEKTMNNTNDQTLIALRLIFASETYESLCSEIEDIYQSELKAARDRTLQTAKKMIEGQLNNQQPTDHDFWG